MKSTSWMKSSLEDEIKSAFADFVMVISVQSFCTYSRHLKRCLVIQSVAWNPLERHRCSYLTLGDLSTSLEMTIPFLVVIQRVENPEACHSEGIQCPKKLRGRVYLLERSFIPVVISTKHSAWRNPLRRSSTTPCKIPTPTVIQSASVESPEKVVHPCKKTTDPVPSSRA